LGLEGGVGWVERRDFAVQGKPRLFVLQNVATYEQLLVDLPNRCLQTSGLLLIK
jgi:hypothetical protein